MIWDSTSVWKRKKILFCMTSQDGTKTKIHHNRKISDYFKKKIELSNV